MEESQPPEQEEGQTQPVPPPKQLTGGRIGDNDNSHALMSPIGTRETDAVTAAGVVEGRGPGSTMEFQPRPVPLYRGLVAFRHRDFRLYWYSQLVSLTGTWMQILAQGWLVLELGGTAFDLGLISALQFLPTLVFALFGGIMADRFPKRYLLVGTQSASMLLAFVLAFLTLAGMVSILDVMILGTILGVVNAVDMPTRQAFVVELVGRKDLPNAVALNSAVFNAARLVGPALGGLLIGWTSLAVVFFLNGVSFIAVIGALWFIRAGSTALADGIESGTIGVHIREGLSYVFRTPMVMLTVGLIAVVATFGMNFNVIAPVFARNILNVEADGFGILMSVMGIGSLVASLMLALLHWEPHPRLMLASAAAFGLLEVVLARTEEFLPACILLGAIGFAMIFLTTVANTTLQTSTPDRLRGRVMSVYTTVFVGTTPLGSLFTGFLAEASGVLAPLAVGGAISIVAALVGRWQVARARL